MSEPIETEQPAMDNFSIGTVLSKSFSTLRSNIVPFGTLVAIFVVPLTILNYMVVGIQNPFDFEAAAQATPNFSWMGISFVLSAIIYGILFSALAFGTVRSLSDDKVSIGELLSVGLSRCFPVIGIYILSLILVYIGFIFLIIPGIIIAVMLAVAIPAGSVEKISVFKALSRSQELTKGSRWSIFGLAIIVFLITLLSSLFFTGLIFAIGIVGLALNTVFGIIIYAWWGVLMATVYSELRRSKEGVGIEELSKVFA